MKSTKGSQPRRHETQKLEVRYGEIGISAVAAAVRYHGDAKATANAEAKGQSEQKAKSRTPEFA